MAKMLTISKVKNAIVLTLVTLTLFAHLSTLYVYSAGQGEQPYIELHQRYILYRDGGGMLLNYTITLRNISNVTPATIEFRYPMQMFEGKNIVYLNSKLGEVNLRTAINKSSEVLSLIIYIDGIKPTEGWVNITLEAYVPLYVSQVLKGEYTFRIVKYPGSNIPIKYARLLVDVPSKTTLLDTLPGASVEYSVTSPEGIVINRIKAEYSQEEISYDSYGIPSSYTIRLGSADPDKPAFILLRGNQTIELTIYPDGLVYYTSVYNFKNVGLDEIPINDRISFFKLKNLVEVKFETALNRSLPTEHSDNYINVGLPYKLRPGDNVILKAHYKILKAGVIVEGLLGEVVKYDILVKPASTHYVEFITIVVKGAYGNIINNITVSYSELYCGIKLNGTINLNVFSSSFREPFYLIGTYLIFFISLAITAKCSAGLILRKKLPEEVKEYVNLASIVMDLIEKAASLDDAYYRKEIKPREYISKRSELTKSLRKYLTELERREPSIKDFAKRNKDVLNILSAVTEIKTLWNKLTKLEKDLSLRKLSLEEYMKERKELISALQMVAKKVKTLISVYR
ncbi:MAG: hypothetical protein QXH96_01160 [Candidatus Geothermarchaeota archaeon]